MLFKVNAPLFLNIIFSFPHLTVHFYIKLANMKRVEKNLMKSYFLQRQFQIKFTDIKYFRLL